MKLLIVVLCYRVAELTIDCLRSLAGEIDQVPGTRVALLENGSGGDSAERLRQAIRENGWDAWVDFSAVDVNLGFCGGNNRLIRAALESPDPPEYVLLLNSDTIVREGALRPLVDFLDEHPRAGIAGSRMVRLDDTTRASPFRFPNILNELDRGLQLGIVSRLLARWALEPPKPDRPAIVDWVSGASMMLRRAMLDQIGLLDEGLYTYFDDVDMGLRAKAAGWETWYVTESRVVHLGGASTGVTAGSIKRRPAYWFQARRRLFLKHYGAAYTAAADAAFIVGHALWQVRRRLQGKPDTAPRDMLADAIRHSVFLTGFRLNEVENPALEEARRLRAASPHPAGAPT